MPNVAPDPLVTWPNRHEQTRASAPAREPSGAFDAMIETNTETTRPVPPPPPARSGVRAERRDTVSDDRREARGEARNERARSESARGGDHPASGRKSTQAKPVDTSVTRQAKDGQPSDTPPETAAAPTGEAAAPAAPVVPSVIQIALAQADGDAVAAQGEAVEAGGATKDDAADADDPATTGETAAKDETGSDTAAIAMPNAKTEVATPVAVAVQAPAAPVAVAEPTEGGTQIEGIAAQAPVSAAPPETPKPAAAPAQAADLAGAMPGEAADATGTVPGTAEAAPATPAPNDKPAAGKPTPDTAAPAKDAQAATVPAAAAPTDAATAEQPALPVAAKASGEATESKTDERKAEAPKAKHDGHRADRASDAQPPQPANAAPVPNAEAQAKPAQQPRGHATDLAALARTTPGEARGENAAAPATTPAAPVANGPIMPFGLALSSSLVGPAQWQPAALRVETPAGNAVPIAGLAVEIVSRAQEGSKRFDIRLDPPELGRIDVRLDVDQGGKVTSRLVVERAETLDLLRRDAHQLERALQHAGLNTEGGMQFSLRDQNNSHRDQFPREGGNVSHLIVPEDEPSASEAVRRGYGRLIGTGGGIDIRV